MGTQTKSGPSVAIPEHRRMLADSVAGVTGRGVDLARVRKLRDTAGEHDAETWKQMADLGWLGILVPERYGGLDMGLAEMAIVAQGLGRALAPEPLVASAVLATTALAHAENDALKAAELPRLAAGKTLAALAWQEQAGVLEPAALSTRATPFEGGYKLTGVKRYIAGAPQADAFLVTAAMEQGMALFWVPRATAGAGLKLEQLADGRSFGTLELKDALIAKSGMAAAGNAAASAVARAFDHAAAMVGAELLGVMGRALEMSLDYLRTRVQFGKPIGSFQALQHRAVDLYIQKELATAVLDESLAALDRGPDAARRGALASRVKARCSDAALKITREAIQLHGAIGFTDEYDVGLYLKRALTLAVWLGGATWHRRRYAQLTAAAEAS